MLLLFGTNSQSSTTVKSGVLRAGQLLPSRGNDTAVARGATLDLNGLISTVGALDASGVVLLGNSPLSVTSLTGSGSLDIGTNSLTVNQNIDMGFSGLINGGGTVIKTGSGTLRLSGASTFSGGAIVSGGILSLGAPTAAGSGTLSVNPSAALDLGASIGNAINLNGGTIGASIGAAVAGTLQVDVASKLLAADPKNPRSETTSLS
jgi:autotransporter-associated beta strand protein